VWFEKFDALYSGIKKSAPGDKLELHPPVVGWPKVSKAPRGHCLARFGGCSCSESDRAADLSEVMLVDELVDIEVR